MPKIFPIDFLFGSSISAYQVEGNNINSDWWKWEQTCQGEKGCPKDKSEGACNYYNMYEDDHNLLVATNQNSFRLSIEWSRVEPKEEEYDQEAIEHYKNILKSLKNKNIKVFLTIYHFTLPQWFQDKGGWNKKRNLKHFKRYCDICAKNFSEYVDFWITINEPYVLVGESFINGHWPPNKKTYPSNIYIQAIAEFIDLTFGLKITNILLPSLRNLTEAHKIAYRVIRRYDPKAKIGFSEHVTRFVRTSNFYLDKLMKRGLNYYFTHKYILENLNYIDFIGINYYSLFKISYMHVYADTTYGKNELDDWPIAPDGLYYTLLDLKKYNLPIYITENGIADADDDDREGFIVRHLMAVHKAIEKGINVKGYLYWSLIDNFEWLHGYSRQFGLFSVDRGNNYKRTIKASANTYAQICKTHEISDDLLNKYPVKELQN